jgi:hypothetical protein
MKKGMYKSDPVLASLEIEKTVQFYEDQLGFKRSWCDENYGIVNRDQISIHFWHCDDKIFPENTSCYIYVDDVEVLFEEYQQSGVVHPNGELEVKPWDMKEFAILDEDGNMIKFGQQL